MSKATATPGASKIVKAGTDGKIDVNWLPNTSRGLFSGLLSARPTQAGTGFNTWVNQGSATVTDTDAGLTLYSPTHGSSESLNLLAKSAPTTLPYTVKALIVRSVLLDSYPSCGLGWRDSSTGKISGVVMLGSNGLYVNTYSSPTASVGIVGTQISGSFKYSPYMWIYLICNDTYAYYYVSGDGVSWLRLRGETKSSAYLGSNGYVQLCFWVNGYSDEIHATMMSYSES